ncbi:MAG: hypothetical protein CVU95_07585 [Firmicutes bacterium HGW-Firmicutes-2]|nr:MAG: hypothetical protein CVU95_07585 [Firmicutes bacterium HGW-Firmicutes-2]
MQRKNESTILFAIMDKVPKKIFIYTHVIDHNLFLKYFSESDSQIMEEALENLKKNRKKQNE